MLSFFTIQELLVTQTRYYAHNILGMSNLAIARNEGVNESKIRKSITHGLRNLKIILKEFVE